MNRQDLHLSCFSSLLLTAVLIGQAHANPAGPSGGSQATSKAIAASNTKLSTSPLPNLGGKPTLPNKQKISGTTKSKTVTTSRRPLQKTVTTTTQTNDPKKYYPVKPGETLYSISVKTGQIFQNLAQWNHLPSPYQVHEGQTLKLFNTTENVPTATAPAPVSTPVPEKAKPVPAKKKSAEIPKPVLVIKKSSAPTIIKQPKTMPPVAIGKKPLIKEKKPSIPMDNKKMVKLGFRWPLSGRVIKSFAQSNNQGIDIENKVPKQSVFAAADGQVVYTGSGLTSLKNLIIIKHNQHYLTAYANNNRVLVNEDQQVSAGQAIAEISAHDGKTNHLHFQIRKNGTPVNPLNLLPQ